MTPPSLFAAIRVWARIGILSFGGPAGQIALMHREVVEARGWLSERQYLDALSFCMLLPGPEAMQLATYAGWRLHGVVGGLAAGLLFVLPGALVILILASLYAAFGDVPVVEALFLGVKAAVVVIVLDALRKVAARALKGAAHWVIAALAFAAIFCVGVPFPLIVMAAGLYGFCFDPAAGGEVPVARQPLAKSMATALTWLAIWLIPLFVLGAFGGLLADIGWFFSRLAVVTFGGAYAVLAYMSQAAVSDFGWLEPGEMMDGLGLAETTPGPLILVTEFVGFLAAAKQGGFWFGVAGAGVALWATFAPCFLWIFTGAPYVEWIGTQPRLKGALAAITAAVVGVILNLSVWFALHVFFADVTATAWGPLTLWLPSLDSFDWRPAVLTAVAAGLLLRLKLSLFIVLGACAALGVALSSL